MVILCYDLTTKQKFGDHENPVSISVRYFFSYLTCYEALLTLKMLEEVFRKCCYKDPCLLECHYAPARKISEYVNYFFSILDLANVAEMAVVLVCC